MAGRYETNRHSNIDGWHFSTKPVGGQKQRQSSGTWEGATNRQQRKLVEVFDKWATTLSREIRTRYSKGATIPELSALVDEQIPHLEKRFLEIQSAGVNSAVGLSARSRAVLPQIQAVRDKLLAENTTLIKMNLVPRIHEKLTLAIAKGVAANAGQLKEVIASTRAWPAAYSGGYWVAIFEVQRGLGQTREQERRDQGLAIEPVRWVLDPTAVHCNDSTDGYHGCPQLAGEYPYGWNSLPTVPAGMVTCRGNCRCHIEVYRDGQWKRGVYDD
jgi:hypothetical protein